MAGLQAAIITPWGHLALEMVPFTGIPAMLHASSAGAAVTSNQPRISPSLSPPPPSLFQQNNRAIIFPHESALVFRWTI